MKDRLMLLVAGVVVSAAAWGFWHFLGPHALDVFTAVVIVLLAVDNMRLRRMGR